MAKAVEFREFTPRNSRDDLTRRLEQAPVEHAEALLAAYDLLQKLHDKGVIDLFNGLLSAGDTIVEHVAGVLASREGVTMLRTTLMLGNLLASMDPNQLQRAISEAEEDKPPSLLAIARKAASSDARRGMAAAVALLQGLGAAMNVQRGKG